MHRRRPRRLREALGPLGAKLKLTFQSRFGRAEWLQALYRQDRRGAWRATASSASPSSRRASPPIAWRRSRRSPSENKEIFLEHGGEQFSYIPCLNDSEAGIGVLLHVIERELKGWA